MAKPCLSCGRLSNSTRCPTCTSAQARARDQRRGNSAQRHYGSAHRRRRAELLPHALGKPCPGCGTPMLDPTTLDAGHSEDLALNPDSKADHILCAHCNRSAGATVRRK